MSSVPLVSPDYQRAICSGSFLVVSANRWQKWLQPEEKGQPFAALAPERRSWLVQTGARYVWTDSRVLEAREALYGNLSRAGADAHQFVVERVASAIGRYVTHFHLFDSATLLAP